MSSNPLPNLNQPALILFLRKAKLWLTEALAAIKIWMEPAHLAQLRPQLRYQSGVLAGFALLASILLGVADLATRGVIELRQEEDLKASLEEVIPAELHDNNLLNDAISIAATESLGFPQTLVYLAKKRDAVTAVCFKFLAPDGYGGAINLVMGLDSKGEILGVRTLSHRETPGLGDKIEISKSNWILSFNGKSLDKLSNSQWAVKKDGGVFDQFAGATITPRKVVISVKQGLDFFRAHRAELLNDKSAD